MVGALMDPIERYIMETFLYNLFVGDEVDYGIREILGHSLKSGGLGIL